MVDDVFVNCLLFVAHIEPVSWEVSVILYEALFEIL